MAVSKEMVVVSTPVDLQRARTSEAEVKVGNRVYPAWTSLQCRTCNHPGRDLIEGLILSGMPFDKIAEFVSDREVVRGGKTEVWPKSSGPAIRRHYIKAHCPSDARMVVERAREIAQRDGSNRLPQYVDQTADGLLFMQQVMQYGHQKFLSGDLVPSFKEVMEATKVVIEAEQKSVDTSPGINAGYVDQLEVSRETNALIFESARRVMSDEQYEDFSAMLVASPQIKELIARATTNHDIIEAEVVRG